MLNEYNKVNNEFNRLQDTAWQLTGEGQKSSVVLFKIMNDLRAHLRLCDNVLDKNSIANWVSHNKWINDSLNSERAKSKQFLVRRELEFSPKSGFYK